MFNFKMKSSCITSRGSRHVNFKMNSSCLTSSLRLKMSTYVMIPLICLIVQSL